MAAPAPRPDSAVAVHGSGTTSERTPGLPREHALPGPGERSDLWQLRARELARLREHDPEKYRRELSAVPSDQESPAAVAHPLDLFERQEELELAGAERPKKTSDTVSPVSLELAGAERPLGNLPSFVTPPRGDGSTTRNQPHTGNGGRAAAALRRTELREAHQRVATSRPQQKCGRVRIAPAVTIRVREDGTAVDLHGLARCGCWSACAECSYRIAVDRGRETQQALARHLEQGGDVLLLTLTLRHSHGDRLRLLYEGLSEAWRRVQNGAPWKRWKLRLGIRGTIRGTDATVGRNGWHPHLHILVLVSEPVPADTLEEFVPWLRKRWADRVVQLLGSAAAPEWEHGVQVTRGESAGRYVAKLGLGREASMMSTKRAADGHRTPFQVLADFAATGRRSDRRLWLEWVAAMKGKCQLFWAPGLRAELLPDVAELSDEEIVAADDVAAVVVMAISAEQWDRIACLPGADRALLAAAWRDADVEQVLSDLLQRAPPRPSAEYQELQAAEDRAQQQIRAQTAGREFRRTARAAGDVRAGTWHGDVWTPMGGAHVDGRIVMDWDDSTGGQAE